MKINNICINNNNTQVHMPKRDLENNSRYSNNQSVSFGKRPISNMDELFSHYLSQLPQSRDDGEILMDLSRLGRKIKNAFCEYCQPESNMNFFQKLVFSDKPKLARMLLEDRELHEETVQKMLQNVDRYGDDALSSAFDMRNSTFAELILARANNKTLGQILTNRNYNAEQPSIDRDDFKANSILNIILDKISQYTKNNKPQKVADILQQGNITDKSQLFMLMNLNKFNQLDEYAQKGDVETLFSIFYELKKKEFANYNKILQTKIDTDEKFREMLVKIGGQNLLNFAKK